MKNEMDLLRMDERQRLAWFMANRGTVIAVGAVWIGMIGWELTHGRVPAFLLIMVPVFALLRAGLYFHYSSRSFVGTESARDPRFVLYVKSAAGILLAAAALLPIYSVADPHGQGTQYRYAWDLVKDDTAAFILPALVYLWPLLILAMSRLWSRSFLQGLIQYAEPVLAAWSAIVILWVPQLIFEARTLFSFLIIPVNPVPQWGCYIVVAANGLYLAGWLAGLLRPWAVQEG